MKITISRSLAIFGIFVAVTSAVSVAEMANTLENVKIEGERYTHIVNGKDLVADILPPPMFLVEAYLLSTEAALHPDMVEENIAQLAKLKSDFNERIEFWKHNYLPEDVKAQLYSNVLSASNAFWTEVEGTFIPALRTGDPEKIGQAADKIRELFRAQKAEVQVLVGKSEAFLETSVADTHEYTNLNTTLSYIAAAAAFVVLLVGLWIFRRRAIVPLADMADYMERLSNGDYEAAVPHADRQDEVGAMAAAVAVLRQAGIDKIELEAENRKQAAIAEKERAQRAEETVQRAADLQKVIDDLGAGLERLSHFNIRFTLDEPFQPEFEALRNDFNKSLAAFQATMTQVLEKATEISNGSDSLRESADQLAKRTEQQAAALEETAAALEEITTNVKNSTERTIETRKRTRVARDNVTKSAEVVQDAVNAMNRIEEASGEIGKITTVIDEIAFQTNLLALNAGVEAARAGDAGKGFAVVAQEVRELAQRSASAAREISELIARSNQEVGNGVDLVNRTGSALEEIEQHIVGIADDIESIATSADEQSLGLSEVNQAVTQMDQITQQNAAMVEEVSAATHSLAGEVQEMVRLVSQFVFNRRSRVRDRPEDKEKTRSLRGFLANADKQNAA